MTLLESSAPVAVKPWGRVCPACSVRKSLYAFKRGHRKCRACEAPAVTLNEQAAVLPLAQPKSSDRRFGETPYLMQRKRGWYCRVCIPRSLRHLFNGRNNLIHTLKTKDLKEAYRRRDPAVAALKEKIAMVRLANVSPAEREALELVQREAADLAQRKADNARLRKLKLQSPEGWAHYKVRRLRMECRQRGVPFNLTVAALMAAMPPDGMCPVLRRPLAYSAGSGNPYSASIDKLVPALGYTIGNVNVISRRANSMKHDCTDPEAFLRLGEWLREKRAALIDANNQESGS